MNIKSIKHNIKRLYLTKDYYPTATIEDFLVGKNLDNKIPNIIHQSWLNRILGRTHADLITYNRNINNNYSWLIHTDSDVELYMRTHYGNHPIIKVYEYFPWGPAKIDIFRYCIILREGGYWLDIKSRVDFPLDDFIPDCSGYVFHENNDLLILPDDQVKLPCPNKYIANWFFGFSPNHPFMHLIIDLIVNRFSVSHKFNNDKNKILAQTGPGIFTLAVHLYLQSKEAISMFVDGIDANGACEYYDDRAECRYVAKKSYSVF